MLGFIFLYVNNIFKVKYNNCNWFFLKYTWIIDYWYLPFLRTNILVYCVAQFRKTKGKKVYENISYFLKVKIQPFPLHTGDPGRAKGPCPVAPPPSTVAGQRSKKFLSNLRRQAFCFHLHFDATGKNEIYSKNLIVLGLLISAVQLTYTYINIPQPDYIFDTISFSDGHGRLVLRKKLIFYSQGYKFLFLLLATKES